MKFLCFVAGLFLLVGCAPSQQEVDLNQLRQKTFETLNKKRTYEPVRISGIKKIEGDNITIVTMTELDVMRVPDIQYDTSDTDLAAKALDVVTAGIVAVGAYKGIQAMGEANRPEVVQQAAPVVVMQPEPVVVHAIAP